MLIPSDVGTWGGAHRKGEIRNCQARKTQLLAGQIENHVWGDGGNGVATKLQSGVER